MCGTGGGGIDWLRGTGSLVLKTPLGGGGSCRALPPTPHTALGLRVTEPDTVHSSTNATGEGGGYLFVG